MTQETKVAVITGGGRGIGKAVALALGETGWSVAVLGRTLEPLEATVGEMVGSGLAIVADVADPSAVDAAFASVVDAFGRVDLLFNNAGIAAPAAPIDQIEVGAFTRLMEVNVTGSFLCARAAFGQMRRQDPQGGRIINNGSVSSQTPRPHSVPYTTSKHAISGLTKCLALDGRPFGITCGQIDIGNVSTDMGDQMAQGMLQANGDTMGEQVMGMDNVTKAVVYMAGLPPEANVLSLTVMSSTMPFVGRG